MMKENPCAQGENMAFETKNAKWWAGLTVVAVAAIVAWFLLSPGGFPLVVLVDDVGGLKKDAPVLWREFPIGKVKEIRPLVDNKIGITIELRSEYASQITRGSEFRLKPAKWLGLIGEDTLEIVTPPKPGAPFQPGEKVEGTVMTADDLLEVGKQWTLEHWEQLKQQTSELVSRFQNSRYRKEIEELLGRIRDLSEEGASVAQGEAEQFQKKHRKDWEDLVNRLEKIRNEMRAAGEESEAREVEKQIERIRRK